MGTVIRVWKLASGGVLTLTQTELIENFRGVEARWFHEEFAKKLANPDSLTYKMIVEQYGEDLVAEILFEIGRAN